MQLVVGHAEIPEQRVVELEHLRVDRRIGRADALERELAVLAVAAALRRRVPVHRRERVQLHRLRLLLHAVLDVRAADRRGSLGTQRRASGRCGPRTCTSPSGRCRSPRRRCARTAPCPRRRASGCGGSRRARRGAPSPPSPSARAAGRTEGRRAFRAAPRCSSRARSSARKGLRASSSPSVVARAVARVDEGLGRIAVGERAHGVEQRVPVGAGQVGASDGAGEEEVAAEQTSVRIEGDVRRRVAGDGDALERDAGDLDRLAAGRAGGRACTGGLGAPAGAKSGYCSSRARSPSGIQTGAPVPSARSATPPRWSKWPCVIRIAAQAAPARASSSRRSAASPPGSITAASGAPRAARTT